jgi:hypothetical protein
VFLPESGFSTLAAGVFFYELTNFAGFIKKKDKHRVDNCHLLIFLSQQGKEFTHWIIQLVFKFTG